MKLVFLGPQGSGKGTQATLLVEKFGFVFFAMGDALREVQKEDSEQSHLVKKILDEGKLVPNEITDGLITTFVNSNDRWIVDGYPRNMGQAKFFDTIATPDKIVVLQLSDEKAIERLGGRRVCEKGHNYHLESKVPLRVGVCDIDGLPLKQRDDDTPDAIKQRLAIYHEKTAEVVEHYKDNVVEIDADPSIEEIHKDIVEKLNL